MTWRRWVVMVAVILATAASPEPPAEPQDYRMDDYRAPTPATLQGAQVLTTEQAHALWIAHDAAFVDVLPQPPRPPGLPASTIWHPKPRFDIPGSIWLPDTGYGALAPVMETYLARGLEQASGQDRKRTLVFYCLQNCWMSWNAAKRAMTMGYTHVAWYRDGTDGWEAAGLPTEAKEPIARPSLSE
jgi:PQQ-dependent catabolism-associated CXXCW motif protein